MNPYERVLWKERIRSNNYQNETLEELDKINTAMVIVIRVGIAVHVVVGISW